MLLKYKVEVMFVYDYEYSGPREFEGYVVAENSRDAHDLIEDEFALKLDLDNNTFFVSLYKDDELIMDNGRNARMGEDGKIEYRYEM